MNGLATLGLFWAADARSQNLRTFVAKPRCRNCVPFGLLDAIALLFLETGEGIGGALRATMQKEWDLRQRTMAFAVAVFRFCRTLSQTSEGWDVLRQLRRSSASVAANYRAAKRASSDALFLAKIAVVVEEADESGFWLEFLVEIGFASPQQTAALLKESSELVAIFTASRKTVEDRIAREEAKRQT